MFNKKWPYLNSEVNNGKDRKHEINKRKFNEYSFVIYESLEISKTVFSQESEVTIYKWV